MYSHQISLKSGPHLAQLLLKEKGCHFFLKHSVYIAQLFLQPRIQPSQSLVPSTKPFNDWTSLFLTVNILWLCPVTYLFTCRLSHRTQWSMLLDVCVRWQLCYLQCLLSIYYLDCKVHTVNWRRYYFIWLCVCLCMCAHACTANRSIKQLGC